MGTTLAKLTGLKNSLQDIRLAVSEKGVTPPQKLSEMGEAIRSIKAGATEEKDFNFYDYEGTLLYSFTRGEIWRMTELPKLPTHEGLITQEWTHTLEDLQGMDRAFVGAIYTTDDGRSRFYLEIPDEAHSEISITYYQSDAAGVTVNWGDALATHIESGKVTMTHKYSPKSYPAKYLMTFRVSQGTLKFENTLNDNMFGPTLAQQSIVKKIELGQGVIIGNYGLQRFYELESITIPKEVQEIGSYALRYLANIRFIAFPRGITKLTDSSLGYAYRLKRLAVPETVYRWEGSATYACYSLDDVVLPTYLNYLYDWNFQNAHLKKLEIPDNVIEVGDGLCRYDASLIEVKLSPSTKLLGSTSFASCTALRKIDLPDTVTMISLNVFNGCESLTSIHIPTQLKEIKERAFSGCYSLSKLSPFPATLTAIGTYAFSGDKLIKEYDFTRLKAIPALGSNAFYGIAEDCVIKVPASLYDEWIVAANWKTYAANIVAV